jgi:uncharacterized Zn ribbon protein
MIETLEKTEAFLDIDFIRMDGATQQRARLNLIHIQTLEDALLESSDLTPIEVIFDGEDYWLVDGFHRVYAYKHCDRPLIPAFVTQGTLRDAILASVAANAENLALPRTRNDKHKAVKTLLLDPEWSNWSDREIAKMAKVDHKTVSAIRKSLVGNSPLENADKVTTVTNANGKTFQRTIKGKSLVRNSALENNDNVKIEDFTARNGHIVPKSALEETGTPLESSPELSKPLENDLKEWFLGFMARLPEFPESYFFVIKQKIQEREEMARLNRKNENDIQSN